MQNKKVRIYQDLESLTTAAAKFFIDFAIHAIEENGRFIVALTGGSTVKGLHTKLASPPYQNKVAWDKVRFFWGDERMVHPSHPESNYGQAYELFLKRVGARNENIFRIRGELALQEAVDDYKEKLRENAGEGLDWPRFDLVFLGMGSDGHVASIFPWENLGVGQNAPVLTTTADYQGRPAQRVSMTPLVFNSAKQILFLVSGESKAEVLRKVLCREGGPNELPALRTQPEEGGTMWYIDKAAASLLPKDILIMAETFIE
jgi:6-phosphogluconolactonase